eukprot:TRINITY_DN27692_c0_g2_i1.p1 TRINITY_DN27692_c0_g2~~TRINITY_DN27692_c0_g2_i1.p1  ORF type:complete len:230 (-),score=33.64 TRINITY_DN27692_c0_g2_i1:36-686(-)
MGYGLPGLLGRLFGVGIIFTCFLYTFVLRLSLKEQLSFYGAYHSDFRNQLIHATFVPLIYWSISVFYGYTAPVIGIFNLGDLICTSYAVFYISLDPIVGSVAAVFYFALHFFAKYLIARERTKTSKAGPSDKAEKPPGVKIWHVAFVLHLVSWYMQIHPGHGIYEGRKPALVDSFFQSLTLAPLFVVYEMMWWMGIDPHGLQPQVAVLVAELQAKM